MSGSDNSQDTWQKIFQPLVVVLLTGLLAFQLPLQSKRPPTDPGPEPSAGIQLDARLWMDPFDAPARDPNHQHKTNLDDMGGQILRHLTGSTHNDKGPLFLAVMVDGGPYFESLERRRRVRYAVISALMDQDYTPEDRDHIRYLHLEHPFNYLDPQGEGRVVSQAERRMPENIPYEWYAPPKGSGQAVMVLWLEEDALAERPLDKLRVIKNLLRLGAMRAIKDSDGNRAVQIALKNVLGVKACQKWRHTEDKSFITQFKKNWCEAKQIEDKLPKESPSPTDLTNNAVIALNRIEQSLTQRKQEPNRAAKEYEFDLTQESFILRYLGPVRAETELLDGIQLQVSECCQHAASDKQNPKLIAANRLNFQVIAPNASDTLLSMVRNAIQLAQEEQEASKPQGTCISKSNIHEGLYNSSKITILSPAATVSSNILTRHFLKTLLQKKEQYYGFRILPKLQKSILPICRYFPEICYQCDLIELFSDAHVDFQRINQNGTDEQLVGALQKELELRGIQDNDDIDKKIALIAERDTLYSRGLVEEFRRIYLKGKAISEYGYFRGLDGESAKKVENKAQGSGNYNSSQKTAQNYDDLMQNIRPRSFDYAYGDDQIDYLRRIADDIERQERDSGQPIRAIGLMGSDVYDKLLILQALKPRFPFAIFFTTELDARYFDRSAEGGFTGIARNLVVVSGRGLEPDGTNSGSHSKVTPKFRSSLQTEYYHAVMASMGVGITEATPKIFEIGSEKAHDLSQLKSALSLKGLFGNSKFWKAIILLVAIIALSGFFISNEFGVKWNNQWFNGALLIILSIVGMSFAVYGSEEPLARPLDGISIWWTEMIRIIAILLGTLFFIPNSCYESENDNNYAASVIKIVVTIVAIIILSLPLLIQQWLMFVDAFTLDWLFLLPPFVYLLFSSAAWMRHLSKFKTGCFIGRENASSEVAESATCAGYNFDIAISNSATYAFSIMAVASAFMSFHPRLMVPYRSMQARWADHIILDLAIGCFIAVLAIVLARGGFVIHTIKNAIKNASTIKEKGDIEKIGEKTRDYYRIVWYPFIMAALLLIARSQVFDNWPMPIGLAMIFTLSFGLLIVCVFRIRSLAFDVKGLLEKSLKQDREKNKDTLEDLKEYQVGAYGSFLAHPSLGGLTLLLGGALPDLIHWLWG